MPLFSDSHNFRRNLIIALVGLQAITVFLILFFSRISTDRVLLEQATQLLENAAEESQVHTSGFLRPAYRTALTSVDLISNNIIDYRDNQEIEQYFLTQLEQHKELAGMYLSTTQGDFQYVSRNQEKLNAVYRTKNIKHLTGVPGVPQVMLHWRDKGLAVIDQEQLFDDDYDPLQRPWYIKAFERNQLIWTEPYIFFTSKKSGITVAAPFYDENKKITGVLGIDIELTSLSKFLSTLNIGQSGSAFISDLNGKFIAISEKHLDDTAIKKRASINYNNQQRSATAKKAISLFFEESNEEEFIRSINFKENGIDYLAAFVPFKLDQNSSEWILTTYAPEHSFLSPIRLTEHRNIAIAVTILLLSMILGWLLTTRAWRPVATWRNQAITDQLTGVYNRHHLFTLGERLYERALSQKDNKLSLAIIDIDHFKNINDTYGHNIGDEAISSVAWRLQNELRPQDIIARFGGEEFIILFPDTDTDTALAVVQRVQESIKKEPIRTKAGPLNLTFSAGVSTISNNETLSFSEFINVADEALYDAKKFGRNQVVSAKC